MARLLPAVVIAAFLGASCTTPRSAEAPVGITVSAASKKSTSTRRQEPGQIACTVSRLPEDPARLSSGNRIQLGWNPHRFRYCCLPLPPRPPRLEIPYEFVRKIGIQ